MVLAALAVNEYNQANSFSSEIPLTTTIIPAPTATITSTLTTTVTVTLSGTNSAFAGGTDIVNGTMKVAFLDSGVDGNTAWYDVRNDGAAPLYIGALYVNAAPAFFNGTSKITPIVSINPIPPGETSRVTAVYPAGTGFYAPSTLIFTIVSAQGLEVSDSIDLVGGTTSTTFTITTTTTTTTNENPNLHKLEFVQASNCPYGSWLIPWAVELGSETLVQPSNATIPTPSSYPNTRITSNSSYSIIMFSIPNGTYSYTILPKNFYGVEVSGNVTVAGSDVEIQISAFVTAMGCSTTSTA